MDIRWLGDENCNDPQRVGPKAANCSRLKEKFNVPPGFCIASVKIEAKHTALDDTEKKEIAESYHKLGQIMGVKNPSVAVRSSAVDEDKPNVSFAGQHDTFLNIIGEEMLFNAIVKCWASSHDDVVKEYRKKHELNLEHIHIAVLIQACIASDVSAVAFSINPVTKSKNEIVINGNFGLGKAIADGSVSPDHFVIDKNNVATIIEMDIHKKVMMTIPSNDGTKDVKVPSFLQEKPSFSPTQLAEVSKMIKKLEENEGYPVDVELAIHNEVLYLLQCRPITGHT